MTEWELLCVTEDIETGDTLRVEISQRIEDMVLIEAGPQLVVCLDKHGIKRNFKTSTLEGFGGPGFIMGKSKRQMKLSDLGKPI